MTGTPTIAIELTTTRLRAKRFTKLKSISLIEKKLKCLLFYDQFSVKHKDMFCEISNLVEIKIDF